LSEPAEAKGAALRAHAARLNAQVVERGRSLASLELDDLGLDRRDRSLLRSMLTESLRWHHRFERQLAVLLDRPLKRRESELAALLRIGLTQLAIMRIPDHAAVSATVAATAVLGLARARGLVNAVLRRYLRERSELELALESDEVARFSHPAWLIDTIRQDWPEDYESLLTANNQRPPFWLRVNRSRTTPDDYLALLQQTGIEASVAAPFADAVLLAEPQPVDTVPGFEAGLVSVQDAAAQRAAELMDLMPGQRVLDACAAPGGKAAHMLERCPGLEVLVALDSDEARLELVRQNLDRLGLSAELVVGDATEPAPWFDGTRFDRVLVDAPCSATGVIRRHPDIKVLRRAEDVARIQAIQSAMLDALWQLVEPGGLLVYCTCSVLRAENVGIVEDFVGRTGDATVGPFPSQGHFQLLPGQTNTDGFYYACLRKGGGSHR
jgi:16S rRNA (cytosine967-C5)-methyltransferase